MKSNSQIKAVFLVTLFCAGTILTACGHDHNSFYPTLADADKAGEMTRGWIPDFLPQSSRNIHLAYDLSPDDEWCAFKFDTADSAALRQTLKPVGDFAEMERGIPNPRVAWWPRVLTGKVNAEGIRPSGLQLYVFTKPVNAVQTAAYTFVIDWKNGQGYFFAR